MTEQAIKGPAYFGPPERRKSYELQIQPPIGQPCLFCRESIKEEDIGSINPAGQITHYECELRMAVGSIEHQLHRCFCYGGKMEDPPGLSNREAALAATALWELSNHRHGTKIMAENELLILKLLDATDGEAYGRDLVKQSGGKLRLGTMFLALSRLEEQGLVTGRNEGTPAIAAVPHRLYQITEAGKQKVGER